MNTSIAISRLLMGASFGSLSAAGVEAEGYDADPRRDADRVIAIDRRGMRKSSISRPARGAGLFDGSKHEGVDRVQEEEH